MIPPGVDREQVTEGVALALVPRSERTLPLVRNPLKHDVMYAWSEDDASATKLALSLLGELLQVAVAGHAGLLNLGAALKEIVSFLIELARHHVRIDDPLQIRILLLLRDADSGLSAAQIRERLGAAATSLASVEQALDRLARTQARAGARPLVRVDGMIWKILV
jgi:hypothetical protein